MRYVIGIDVGTTGTKALLVSEEGRLVAQATQKYGVSTPSPGWAEQSPDDLWRACVHTVRAVASHSRPEDIAGIGLSTQGGTIIGLDQNRVPTGTAITWLDRRSEAEGSRLAREKGEEFFLKRTGVNGPGLIVPNLLWVKQHAPERFWSTRHWGFVNDYVVFRLTGRPVADPSNVCLCGLFDLWRNRYAADILSLAGLSEDLLAPIRESGTPAGVLTLQAAEELGLCTSTVVGAAGHDQYCAALGAGIVNPGDVLLSCGTAWVLLSPTRGPVADPQGDLWPGRHLLPGLHGMLAAISDGGVVWDWFGRLLYGDQMDYAEVEQMVGSVPPGCEGVWYWPGFLRTDTPWPVGPGGALLGFSLSATRGHILRSVMEGLAMESRRRLQQMARLGIKTHGVTMIGGAAQSGIWPQIVSDVLNLPVAVPKEKEAAALGASVLGLKAAGLITDLEEGCRMVRQEAREFSPDRVRRAVYDRLFCKYKKISGD